MTVLVRPRPYQRPRRAGAFRGPILLARQPRGQSEASLLELARSYDPDELTSSDCHEQPDLSFTRQCLSLPAQVHKEALGGFIVPTVAPHLASIIRGLLVSGPCTWISSRQEAPSCPIPSP